MFVSTLFAVILSLSSLAQAEELSEGDVEANNWHNSMVLLDLDKKYKRCHDNVMLKPNGKRRRMTSVRWGAISRCQTSVKLKALVEEHYRLQARVETLEALVFTEE